MSKTVYLSAEVIIDVPFHVDAIQTQRWSLYE